MTKAAVFAAKAPTHHSLRGESMGNAHVAVVDDKEAIYYNYAGLSQINRLGNYDKRPEQGYYPRNFLGDARINIGGAVIPFLLCAYLIIGAHTASRASATSLSVRFSALATSAGVTCVNSKMVLRLKMALYT